MNSRSRSLAPLAWLAAALFAAGCSGVPAPPADAPNLIVVTLDTTRVDRFGVYGNQRGLTPNFDALAAEGVQFRRAIAQASTTPVSHASIFTGLEPQNHGLRVIYAEQGSKLPSDVPVMAELLQRAGWDTAAFLSSFTVSEYYALDRGFDSFDNGLFGMVDTKLQQDDTGNYNWDAQTNQRRSDSTTEEAILWLRQQPRDRPFFLWIHYWDPHDITIVPPDVMTKFRGAGVGRTEGRRLIYDAEVEYVDRQFGTLVAELRELGEYDDSIVMVVADHGEGLMDHGWFEHRILYQEQIHVPLLMRGPGLPQGRQVGQVVRTTDMLPTVTELLDLDSPPNLDGRSLLELIDDDTAPSRVAIAEALNKFDLNSVGVHRPQDELLHSVIDGEWKLIYRPLDPAGSELYNLASDPRELTNVFDSAIDHARPLMVKLHESGALIYPEFGDARDPEALERLRSLGYAGN